MSQVLESLIASLESRRALTGIIGLGHVGLPLALAFASRGRQVLGFDIDARKVEGIARGECYIKHLDGGRLASAVVAGLLSATGEFDRLSECDAIVICVPTPLGRHREPDLSYVRSTGDCVARTLRRGQLVVLESTTYPGTTREELLPRFQSRGLKCGEDFFLAFSPEREDPGNREYTTTHIPKLVGGIDEASRAAAVALYGGVVDSVVPVASAEVAEAAKLMENIFRAVNIALVNEMKVILDRMGIDIWQVIEAAKTKPFGFMPFYPGPGLGGHCIPVDPFYLTWKAAEHGHWARFIELAGEVNASMPRYVVGKVIEGLNAMGRSLAGAKVLVLGLSYKPDVDDDRESPSFEIIELLREKNAAVAYCDPHVPVAKAKRRHDIGLTSVPCTAEEFARHDAVVVATAHQVFRDPYLYQNVSLVIDTRNIVRPGAERPRVLRA